MAKKTTYKELEEELRKSLQNSTAVKIGTFFGILVGFLRILTSFIVLTAVMLISIAVIVWSYRFIFGV